MMLGKPCRSDELFFYRSLEVKLDLCKVCLKRSQRRSLLESGMLHLGTEHDVGSFQNGTKIPHTDLSNPWLLKTEHFLHLFIALPLGPVVFSRRNNS